MRWYKMGTEEVQANSPAEAQRIIKQRKAWEKKQEKKEANKPSFRR